MSPSAGLSIRDLIGRVIPRDRTLTDAELAAVWRATEGLGHAARAFVRLLLLTGQRLREVAFMSWSEVDFPKSLWTIPGGRMKTGSAHIVPLAPEALAILQSLPRGTGPYVLSTTGGRRPISGFSKLKARLDSGIPEKIAPWRFHDLRRSMRTGLSMLVISDTVSELCIAHSQRGLHKVYDQHSYFTEKLAALTKWEGHLLAVCEPGERSNVIPMTAPMKKNIIARGADMAPEKDAWLSAKWSAACRCEPGAMR